MSRQEKNNLGAPKFENPAQAKDAIDKGVALALGIFLQGLPPKTHVLLDQIPYDSENIQAAMAKFAKQLQGLSPADQERVANALAAPAQDILGKFGSVFELIRNQKENPAAVPAPETEQREGK